MQLLVLAPLLPAQDETIAIPPIEDSERICFALYTVHDNTLKLTAQLYPLENLDDLFVTMQIELDGAWVDTAKSDVIYPGYTAPFSIENWDDTKDALGMTGLC